MPNFSRESYFNSKVLANKSLTIGLVLIPKCGSTSFRFRHDLTEWINQEEQYKIKNLVCFIRDPKKRFLSSVVETLGRIYCPEIEKTYFPGADVPVNAETFEFFNFSNLSTPKEYLNTFMKAIKEYGFFDDHNLPIYNCLFKNNETYSNPLIFDLNSMNNVSKYLNKSLDLKTFDKHLKVRNVKSKQSKKLELINEHINLKKISRHSKNILKKPYIYKNFLGRMKYLLIPYLRGKTFSHFDPLLSISKFYSNRSFFSKKEMMQIFYKDIFIAANENKDQLDEFLNTYYANDLLIYKNFSNYKKEISLEDIPLNVPKLKDLI